jgi:hypothetical protein
MYILRVNVTDVAGRPIDDAVVRYLLPQGNLCASCPLVSHDERLRRNAEFMERQLVRASV